MALQEAAKGTPRRANTILAIIRRLIFAGPNLLLDSLKLLLPTAIIFVKFLEWWYSPSSPARAFSTSTLGPHVPPPSLLEPHPQGAIVNKDMYGQCPLCRNFISNAVVLPSGYVFCFRCAHDYIEEHSRCPVTFLPTEISQMRKILV